MATNRIVIDEWNKRLESIKSGKVTDTLVLTTSEDLLEESRLSSRPFAVAEEDIVTQGAENFITNVILMGTSLTAQPVFEYSERESGYGLTLIGDVTINNQKYLTCLRCLVPFVTWDHNYDVLCFGTTTYEEGIDGAQHPRYYTFMDSDPCYEQVYQLTNDTIKVCGKLLRLANKANVSEDDESSDGEEKSETVENANDAADSEEYENISQELDVIAFKLYGEEVNKTIDEDDDESWRDMFKFIVDQAVSLDIQIPEQRSLTYSEFILPIVVKSRFDQRPIFLELNRDEEFNQVLKRLGNKFRKDNDLKFIQERSSGKRRKVERGVQQQQLRRNQAKVVERAATTASTVLTKYVFSHTAPLLMNDDSPKIVENDQMLHPRLKRAREDRVWNTKLVRLDGIQWTEKEGEGKSIDYCESLTIRHTDKDKQHIIEVGDFIRLKDGFTFVRIVFIMKETRKNGAIENVKIHGPVLDQISRSAIGEQGRANELLYAYECSTFNLSEVDKPVLIHRIPEMTHEEFRELNSQQMLDLYIRPSEDCDLQDYFVRQCYLKSVPKFVYDEETLEMLFAPEPKQCYCYKTAKATTIGHMMQTDETEVMVGKHKYKTGDVLMFVPNSLAPKIKRVPRFFEKFFDIELMRQATKEFEADPEKYPELDRFVNWFEKPEFKDHAFGDPYDIGMLTDVDLDEKKNVVLRIRRFVRPEETSMTDVELLETDRHMLFLSDEVSTLVDPYATKSLIGQCFVTANENLRGKENQSELKKWLNDGDLRFYCFYTVRQSSGIIGKKLDVVDAEALNRSAAKGASYPKLDKPLRKFDMFSGAGGMSSGLHAAGLSEARYAVEFVKSHADVYKQNFPEAAVFHTDVNLMFEKMEEGKDCDPQTKQRYPRRGDVDLICGGPPCQGFSGMNSAKHEKAGTSKRSLVSSFMAMIDLLRPLFVLMENVSGMAMTVKTGVMDEEKKNEMGKAEVLSVLMEVLRAMGYQVTIKKLQAARHGVPQDRRRILILAAAPGQKLPDWPKPTTTCPINLTTAQEHHIYLKINGFVYRDERPQLHDFPASAPYRGVSVYEAIAGITHTAEIESATKGSSKKMISYMLATGDWGGGCQFPNHVVAPMAPLLEARIKHVPKSFEVPYADWRLLPNVIYKMSNGKNVDKLKYDYSAFLYSSAKDELQPNRGVCICNTNPKKKCTRENRRLQNNTLIPAALPHTAPRFQQWQGLFGRPFIHGVFQTIVTVPNPFNKQGQCIHPEEDRLLSVREMARGQGFPDDFVFDSDIASVSVNAQYEQVGNAVPPPLALAIGHSLISVLQK